MRTTYKAHDEFDPLEASPFEYSSSCF